MLINVKSDIDDFQITKVIRTEDISECSEDAYERNRTRIDFYDHRDTLIINEDIKSFSKRFIKMELDYFYEEGDNFESDEDLINKINEDT